MLLYSVWHKFYDVLVCMQVFKDVRQFETERINLYCIVRDTSAYAANDFHRLLHNYNDLRENEVCEQSESRQDE